MQSGLICQQQSRQLSFPVIREERSMSVSMRQLAANLNFRRGLLINQRPLPKVPLGQPDRPLISDAIELPGTELPAISLQQVLHQRHSARDYASQALDLQALSALLQHAAGLRQQHNRTGFGRTYPSGGACYPIQLYVQVKRVNGLAAGTYLYESAGHQLSRLSKQADLANQPFHPDCAVVLLMVNNWSVQSRKYGDISFKLALLEAGHLAQNLTLAATALSLSSIPLQFYFEHEINQQLGLNPTMASVCYAIEVGQSRTMNKE